MLDRDGWETAGAVGAALTALVAATRALRRPLGRVLGALRRLLRVPANVERTFHLVEQLAARADVMDARHWWMVERMGMAAWESDLDGKCLAASEELATKMGCPVEEILGYGWANWIHPDDRDRVEREWNASISRRIAFASRYRFLHADGKAVTVFARATPARGRTGDPVRYIGWAVELSGEGG